MNVGWAFSPTTCLKVFSSTFTLVKFLYFTYNLVMENIKRIKLRDFEIGGDKLTILAGPCAIESKEILDETAKRFERNYKKNWI